MSKTFCLCLHCMYWIPHNVGEDKLPVKSRMFPNGRCHICLPPYLMAREPASFNTDENQGCDLGKFGPTWTQAFHEEGFGK